MDIQQEDKNKKVSRLLFGFSSLFSFLLFRCAQTMDQNRYTAPTRQRRGGTSASGVK